MRLQHSDKDQSSEIIALWLRWKYNYDKEGKPSWKNLVKAVHPIESSLAERIAQAHNGNSAKPFKLPYTQ